MWCDLVEQGCQCGVTWLNRGVTFLTDRYDLVLPRVRVSVWGVNM